MAISAKVVTSLLIFFLVFLVGGILLQRFLSKRESKWPGLVLPLLSFLLSLTGILNIMDTGSVSQNLLLVLTVVLLGNIPTVILLAIYWACREKRRRKDQIEKMNIDDL